MTSTHRSHGHYIALTNDSYGLIAELMGKRSGVVAGKGASQHVQYKNLYTNGITGGMIPIAVGIGFGIKLMKGNNCP